MKKLQLLMVSAIKYFVRLSNRETSIASYFLIVYILETDKVNEVVSKPKRAKVIPRILDGTYFRIETNEDGRICARCTICDHQTKGQLTSTGNFLTHYKNRHGSLMETVKIYLKGNNNSKPNEVQPLIQPFLQPLQAEKVGV